MGYLIGTELVISYTPFHNAKGFKVFCKPMKGSKEFLINLSMPTFINLTEIGNEKVLEVKMVPF